MISIKPMGDRIVLKAVAETNATSGGIIIPDIATGRSQIHEVVAVGEKCRFREDLKPGDRVYIAPFAGTSATNQVGPSDGQLILVMSGDVLCRLDPAD